MGAYASNFQPDTEGSVGSFTNPREDNWISAHATTTELAIPEVERLWERFKQLGCDENGVLTTDADLSPHLSQDAFIRNILKCLKRGDGTITFQSFLMALKWMETEDMDKKLRATFHLLNNGHPINKEILGKILRRVYPEDSDAAISRLSGVFFQQMDDVRQGYITEDQFIAWVMRMPQETIEQIMEFHILPADISSDAQKQLSERSSTAMTGSYYSQPVSDSRGKQVPSDAVLMEVSEKIYRRDWFLVGNKLGLLNRDMEYFVDRFPGDPREQSYQMLLLWKKKHGSAAYSMDLEKALRASSMSDTAIILSPT